MSQSKVANFSELPLEALHKKFAKSGRLIEVGRLKVALLWKLFIKNSLGVGQGNELLAVLQRWPS